MSIVYSVWALVVAIAVFSLRGNIDNGAYLLVLSVLWLGFVLDDAIRSK